MLQAPVTIPKYGTTYGNWKGVTGPGAMLSGINPKFRPGFGKALSKAYADYCGSDGCPKAAGPCPIRAAKHAELAAGLRVKFPSVEETLLTKDKGMV